MRVEHLLLNVFEAQGLRLRKRGIARALVSDLRLDLVVAMLQIPILLGQRFGGGLRPGRAGLAPLPLGPVVERPLRHLLAPQQVGFEPLSKIDAGLGQTVEQGSGPRPLAGFEGRRRQPLVRMGPLQPHEDVHVELVVAVHGSGVRGAQVPVVDLGAERLGHRQRLLDVSSRRVEVAKAHR